MAKRPSILDRLLGKDKPEDAPHSTLPSAVQPEPELQYEDFTEVGGSPVPGITLKHVLPGPISFISPSAWSPYGIYFATKPDFPKIEISDPIEFGVRIWNVTKGDEIFLPVKQETKFMIAKDDDYYHSIPSISWSPDGKYLAACYHFSQDAYPRTPDQGSSIYIWNTENWRISLQTEPELNEWGGEIAWSPDQSTIAVASRTEGLIFIDPKNGEIKNKLFDGKNTKNPLWSPNGKKILLGIDHKIHIYNLHGSHFEYVFERDDIRNHFFIWHPNREILASNAKTLSNWDKFTWDLSLATIFIWDIEKRGLQRELEGHTSEVQDFCFYSGGEILISVSKNEMRLWHTDSWESVAINNLESVIGRQIALHPQLPIFASLGKNKELRIWKSDYNQTLEGTSSQESVQYTTAKIVLVGDSGVGKTGLGWRLAHGEFKEHSSTHGQQFWVTPALSTQRQDGTECEAVLWDLAGQHVYRSMHSIFLEDVDAALVLFDPTNRQEPLKGADSWLEQLGGKKALPPSVLVGARVDRGAPIMSQQDLETYCQEHGITGGYVSTSAKSGEGLETLVQTLQNQIPWDQMTATVTTLTFKRIKEFVLSLKERPERKGVLVKPDELRKQLQDTDTGWQFTDAEMMTAVNHLENHGYVTILKSSLGEEYILLVPELLVSAAASIFLLADKHPRELGAINETGLLQRKYPIEEFKDLGREEQEVLLDTIVMRFLEHHVCFRDTSGSDNLLIFPSLIKQKRPPQEDVLFTEGISYIVRGKIENLYASLVVLLGYTSSFRRMEQWANQAQYETEKGNICGFKLRADHEGELEFTLYYENTMPEEDQANFQDLFEEFLHQRKVEIRRFPPVLCPEGHPQEHATVMKRIQEKKIFTFCAECGGKVILPEIDKPGISTTTSPWLQVEAAKVSLRSLYETHLSSIKAYRRNWDSPRCYISYLPRQIAFVERLKQDLNKSGVYLIAEASLVQTDDRVVVLDSPEYQHAWKTQTLGEDMALIEARLNTDRLISIVLKGNAVAAHDLSSCQGLDFSDETHYFISLFNLVLGMYDIPTLKRFESMRLSLHEQWEQTLARSSRKAETGDTMATPLKIFISYSHRDEEFKDELVMMLAGLQRRGVIDAWQDRRIEAGDEWYQEIQEAMNDCDLAILLVSASFIASSFIQDEELTRLLKRRMEEGLRVVPIIVKSCMWQSEPVLKDIQVLPRDGKPVISFSKDTGDRDQVWTDIARVIEKQAKK